MIIVANLNGHPVDESAYLISRELLEKVEESGESARDSELPLHRDGRRVGEDDCGGGIITFPEEESGVVHEKLKVRRRCGCGRTGKLVARRRVSDALILLFGGTLN